MKRICKKCDTNESPKGKKYCDDCVKESKIRLCKNCGVIELSKGKKYCNQCAQDGERKAKLPSANKLYVYRKLKTPRICSRCKQTELNKGKHLCDSCKKPHVKAIRLVKIKLIIPDHITDPIERKKYYNKEYNKIHHKKYFVLTDEKREARRVRKRLYKQKKADEVKQKKITDFNNLIDQVCNKHNLDRDYYLIVRSNTHKNSKRYKEYKCESFDDYVIISRTCCSCKSLNLSSRYVSSTKDPGVYCKECFKPSRSIYKGTKEDIILRVKNKLLKLYVNMDFTFKWETYKNRATPMTVICKKHGEFQRKPDSLFGFTHCPKCRKPNRPTREDRIKESITQFGNHRFDYSKYEYINKEIKSIFICKKHNTEFEQTFRNHITGKVSCIDCRTELGRMSDYSKMGLSRIRSESERDLLNFKNRVRSRIMNGIKTRIKVVLSDINYKLKPSNTFDNIIGLDVLKFKEYIESKWEPWMSWENYGLFKTGEYNVGWDLDHVIPISTSVDEESTLKLWHYTNLQPLCSRVNRYDKGGKLNYQV